MNKEGREKREKKKRDELTRDYEDYGKPTWLHMWDFTRTCNFTITANLLTLENSPPNCWVPESGRSRTGFAARLLPAIMLNSLKYSKRSKRPPERSVVATIILIVSLSQTALSNTSLRGGNLLQTSIEDSNRFGRFSARRSIRGRSCKTDCLDHACQILDEIIECY